MNMFDNYIVPVFFGGGALALLGLVLFGWALPSFLKGKWSYLISLLGLGFGCFLPILMRRLLSLIKSGLDC